MPTNLLALNRQILVKLMVVVVLMFGFGYALVPMYQALCEVTGINVLTNKNDYGTRAFRPNKSTNTQVDYTRTVTVEFDSNSRGPFTFKPLKNYLEVHPGEMVQIMYEVVNNFDRPIMAQAIPSYTPKIATEYFTKLECFCFQQQTLGPLQAKELPVVFVVDRSLPKDVKTIILSYTFFEINAGQKAVTPPAAKALI